MKDVMLDLETLSSSPRAAIVSIGAVAFDWRRDLPLDKDLVPSSLFKMNVAMVGVEKRFDISGDTVEWWFKQTDEARAALRDPIPSHIANALASFSGWIRDLDLAPDWRLWGNAPSFDNLILRNAYEVCRMPAPWRFPQDHCYRTLKNLLDPNYELAPAREGGYIAHDALDDAYRQAAHCGTLLRLLAKRGIELDTLARTC